MAEFPNASTTGVRDGVTLTPSGGITIDTAGAVVSGLNITGDVVITAPNVTLVDCRVTGSIIVQSTGATIEYVDAVGRNSLNTIDINPNGRAGEGDNTTVRFCDISGSENGIWLEGDGCLIEDNYIHNLFSNTGASDPHIDGIQIPGKYSFTTTTENVIIRHNNIDLDVRTASASITMKDGINIDIIDNRLSGGSAVIYFEGDSRDCDVINNVFDEYAYFHIAGASWQEQAYSGNTDEATGSLLSFNDDPTAPAIPATPAITSFSADSGTAGDRITNDNTLALVGTAAANSTVQVFDGSTQIGTATANSSGAWSVTTARLADGSHSLTATATNSGGTSSTPAPFLVTIDTIAPSVPTIQTSTSAETLASTQVAVLTGTAEANSTVVVFDGTTMVGSAVATSSGAWSYTTAVLSTGSHSFTATATDVAGNTGAASSAAVVTIADAPEPDGSPEPDGTPEPTPTILSFSSDSGVTGDRITNDNTLTLTGTAAAGATVAVYDSAALLGSATANSSGAWSYTTGTLSGGTHSFTAATDASGAPSGFPDASTTGVSAGTVLRPSGSITIKTPGAVVSGLDITGYVSIEASDVTLRDCRITATSFWAVAVLAPNVTIENCEIVSDYKSGGTKGIYFDDGAFGGVARNNDIHDVEDGVYISTRDIQIEGNYIHNLNSNGSDPHYDGIQLHGGVSGEVNIVGNSIIGTNSINSAITMGTVQNVLIEGNHLVGGGYTIHVDGRFGDGTVSNVSIIDNVFGSHTYGYWTFELSNPTHMGNVTEAGAALDQPLAEVAAGDALAASAAFLVTIDTIAPSAPTIEASTSPETLASANVEVLTGTAEAGSTVTVFDGATRLGAVTADASGAWSYISGVLSVGSHSFTARATDVAGNTGASSSAAVVTIADAPEPVPEPGGTPDPGGAPEVNIDITYLQQSRSGVTKLKGMADPGAVVELLDGSTSLGSTVAGADGSWAFSKSGLSKTVHSITAQEVDGSGQVVAKSSGAALLGSTGNDALTGTAGNDVLLSNGGNDTFVFNENFGRDVIRDFDSIGRSHDVVQFGTTVFDSFASVLEHASQVGRDVVITAGTDELTLKNTKLSTLDSHDFHFA